MGYLEDTGSIPVSDICHVCQGGRVGIGAKPKIFNSFFPNNILQVYSEYCKIVTLKVIFIPS